MAGHQPHTVRSGVPLEDVLLGILGLIAGPLLWCMGQMWQQLPTSSSIQTFEYWIALGCGLLGAALCVLWFIFLVAGLGLIIGMKTRNALITYWSELFTPKFLRRLIISVFGAQLALSSQAIAAPSEAETQTVESIEEPEPFMPYIHEPANTDTAPPEAVRSPTASQSPEVPIASASPSDASTTKPSPPVEPRQHSEVTISPAPAASAVPHEKLQPEPRQTSSVDIEADSPSDAHTASPGFRKTFVPQKPLTSPYISAPQQHRTTEDLTLVVISGDCLWDIAHHELGADASLFQIDRRWREWWDYNRAIIGEDPHILSPGTVLHAPPFTQ